MPCSGCSALHGVNPNFMIKFISEKARSTNAALTGQAAIKLNQY